MFPKSAIDLVIPSDSGLISRFYIEISVVTKWNGYVKSL